MKRIKEKVNKLVADHLVLVWAIISIAFMVIIHLLFSVDAPVKWLQAKWGAGDILTFVSTVSLGLLAIWQNRKFKYENDSTQQRLENIIVQSNEIVSVNKVIEIESESLARAKRAFDDFSRACNPQKIISDIGDSALTENAKLALSLSLTKTENLIDDTFFSLCRELRLSPKIRNSDENPLKRSLATYYYGAKNVINKLRKGSITDISEDISRLASARDTFYGERERFLRHKESLLSRAIYTNMALSEIKQMYKNEMGFTDSNLEK